MSPRRWPWPRLAGVRTTAWPRRWLRSAGCSASAAWRPGCTTRPTCWAARGSGRQWAGLAGSVGELDPLVGVDPDQAVSRQLVDQLAPIAEVAHTHPFAGG